MQQDWDMPLRAPQHTCTQDGGVCSITGHAGHGEGVHTHIDAHSGYQTENTPEYTQLYMGPDGGRALSVWVAGKGAPWKR